MITRKDTVLYLKLTSATPDPWLQEDIDKRKGFAID